MISQSKIDLNRMGKLVCLIASVLPPLLSAQGAPHLIPAAAPPPGQASSAARLPVAPAPPVSFREVGVQAGLSTVPHSISERRYIVETMGGGGIALFDCDNDGRLDIAVVNDSTIDRFLAGGDAMITLYHQDGSGGNLHFTDITEAAGLTTRGWGMAIAVGDYDNDGLPDLYVTGYGHNVLYHNLGGCRFEDVTRTSRRARRVASAPVLPGLITTATATSICLLPATWIRTFITFPLPILMCRGTGRSYSRCPTKWKAKATFSSAIAATEPSKMSREKAGVSNPRKLHGMGVVWGDYDNDGWPDLYVTNDGGPNYLYHNNGDGTFTENGILSGTATGAHGEIYGNMAADFGDFNRDGKLDLVTTRYSRQPVSLYRNDEMRFYRCRRRSRAGSTNAGAGEVGCGLRRLRQRRLARYPDRQRQFFFADGQAGNGSQIR